MNTIYSLHQNVKSSVKFENEISQTLVTSLGTRQRDSLSPFIFSIYVNDLEVEMAKNGFKGIDMNTLKLFILLYADDIVILSETET